MMGSKKDIHNEEPETVLDDQDKDNESNNTVAEARVNHSKFLHSLSGVMSSNVEFYVELCVDRQWTSGGTKLVTMKQVIIININLRTTFS